MIDWTPPQEAAPDVSPLLGKEFIPEQLRAYEFLLTDGKVTPELIESMKRGYAKAWERLCKNAEYITQFKGAEHDRHWLLWQIDCCEPCNVYIRLFKLFRDKDLMSFADDELYNCFGLYEYIPKETTQ
jgi:hypothetical protein